MRHNITLRNLVTRLQVFVCVCVCVCMYVCVCVCVCVRLLGFAPQEFCSLWSQTLENVGTANRGRDK